VCWMNNDWSMQPVIGVANSKRLVILLALGLFLIQTAAILLLPGTINAALISESSQVLLGGVCLFACLRARSVAGAACSHHWGWLAAAFVGFIVAQGVGIYIDLSSNHFFDWIDDVLFALSVAPMAMLPFLDPDREHSRFDRLHVLDFVQVSCFWVSVYLFFSNSPGMGVATTGWKGFGWSSSLVFDVVLTLSFLMRVILSRSTAARVFFGAMAAYVFLAGLADSYASLPTNNVQPGHSFDLVWSMLLGIPLLVSVTCDSNASLSLQPRRAERIISNHLFPLVYPFFAVLTLVQDARRWPMLVSAIAMVVFGTLAVRILIIQHRLFHVQEQLEFDASHDALTRSYNRSAILETLEKEIARHSRTKQPLTVMLADIDHFKAVNDSYGHLAGDRVLSEVVRRIGASKRISDSVGRYGGEEFLIIVPECDTAGALSAAERIRMAVAGSPVHTSDAAISVSISLGVTTAKVIGSDMQPSKLLRCTDEALYRAKTAGRNRAEFADVEPRSRLTPSDSERRAPLSGQSVAMHVL